MNVQTLKNLTVDRIVDLAELIAHEGFAAGLATNYANHGLEVPEWLESARRTLRGEVKMRVRGDLERQLKLAEQAEEALKSTTEKRADAKKRAEVLRKQLAQV